MHRTRTPLSKYHTITTAFTSLICVVVVPSTLLHAQTNRGASTAALQETLDWSSFRGPGGMGVADNSELPLEWDESNVVWKTRLPGAGASSPITHGRHIYLTAYSGHFVPGDAEGNVESLHRHVIALDRDHGQILWDKKIKAKLPEEERIRDHGYAANTPVSDSDRVYAFLGKTGVFAFDHQGNELWQADVGEDTSGWGTAASPILFEDLVIVNASVESKSLIALDRKTGAQRWKASDIREAWNTPVIITTPSGRKELILSRHGDVLAFDPKNGKPLWSCKTDITWYMVPTAVAAEGVVYVLGGRSGTAGLAVRAGGSGDVTDTHRIWTSNAGSNVTSPLLKDGHLYWMSDNSGIAYCAKADTGELLYEQRLNRAGQIYACPILANDKIYYLNRRGKTFVVAAKPEFELLATNELNDGSRFDASPAVDGNRLLLRSEKFLYCIAE